MGLGNFQYQSYPVTFWDVYGKKGLNVRTTISEMGPELLARLLGLNDTQAGILRIVFRIADEKGLMLIDLKDLRAMVEHVGANAKDYKLIYGSTIPAYVALNQTEGQAPQETSQNWELTEGQPGEEHKITVYFETAHPAGTIFDLFFSYGTVD